MTSFLFAEFYFARLFSSRSVERRVVCVTVNERVGLCKVTVTLALCRSLECGMHSIDRIRGGVMHVSRFRSSSRTEGLTRPRGADLSGGFVRVLGLVCVSSGWFFLLVRLRVDVRAISCRTDVSVIFALCCFGGSLLCP